MREQMSSRNRLLGSAKAFTLIEVLVSIVILTVGLLGMFQAVNMAMDVNVKNELRSKSVAVAEAELASLKARPFNAISTGTPSKSVSVTSGAIFKNISVTKQVTDLSASDVKTKKVSIRVWYKYRGQLYEHQTASAIGSSELSSGN